MGKIGNAGIGRANTSIYGNFYLFSGSGIGYCRR
jgi:hypothetical protein